ncbi:MAG: methyltransferase domain-containing protein [Oscillospiraceae bacterium]|nr:methyltransferase domain-containing protein [Oscillospiraceae bacterium]
MAFFICPVCGAPLSKNDKVYFCENSHSFDISRKGYVNLLMSSGKGKIHGDDKKMIAARADFLNRGFYDKLSQKVSELVAEYTKNGGVVLDAGCGEGKYTADIYTYAKENGKDLDVIGVDISKDAVNLAASRSRELLLAVASAASLPLSDGSVDVIVNIFAPFFAEEFSRVLAPNGVAVRVYPLARHLFELKELVYENPYENPEPDMEECGFSICERLALCYDMTLCASDAMSLFEMTPYFYRTGERDREKICTIDTISVRAEFGITVYKKKL